jgi:endonuclease/exonuclease/phosphatase (EEP) superfamily protein YafD
MQVLATLLAVALPLASLLAYAAARFWWADLLVHFRLHYLLLALLLLALALWQRRRGWQFAAVLTLLLNAPAALQGGTAVLLRPAQAQPVAATAGQPVRIAALNLLWRNTRHAAALDWARGTDADILVFVEVDSRWQRALQALRQQYPHARALQRAGHSGTLLLSRWPLQAATPLDAGTPGTPELVVDVATPGGALRVIAVHATWPLGPAVSAARAREFALIADTASATTLPLVAIGDFNVTPASPHFTVLLERGRLRDAAAGRGGQPTWPSLLPWLGLRIDHALVSPQVAVNSYARGRVEGSDHRPIVVDLQVPLRGGSVHARGIGRDRERH